MMVFRAAASIMMMLLCTGLVVASTTSEQRRRLGFAPPPPPPPASPKPTLAPTETFAPTIAPSDAEVCINPDDNRNLTCGTVSPTDCQKVMTWIQSNDATIFLGGQQINRGRHNLLRQDEQEEQQLLAAAEGSAVVASAVRSRELSYTTDYEIKVKVHVIRGNGYGGLSRGDCEEFVHRLNNHFVGDDSNNPKTPFKFVFSERLVDHNHPEWHVFSPATVNVMKATLKKGSIRVLNVYVGDMRLLGYIGVSTFPHQLLVPDSRPLDGVLIMNPNLYSQADIDEAAADGTNLQEEVYESMVHEAGHWLGLLHTFESTSCNSDPFAGDGVADTPVSKCPSWDFGDYQECFVTRQQPQGSGTRKRIDTCSNVDDGHEDVHNIMNYIDEDCMALQGHFTSGQIDRMVAQFEVFRLENYDYPNRRTRRRRRTATAASERRAADLADEFPGETIVQVCLSSALVECDCEYSCTEGVLTDLRENFPALYNEIINDLVLACHSCSTLDSDMECPANEYCAEGIQSTSSGGSGWKLGQHCIPKKTVTEACTQDDMCASGYCVNSQNDPLSPPDLQCLLGAGDVCSVDQDCASQDCDDTSGGTNCATGDSSGILCAEHSDCDSNLCDSSNKCATCTDDSDCQSRSRYCDGAGQCRLKKPAGRSCVASNECFGADDLRCLSGICQECKTTNDCIGFSVLPGSYCHQVTLDSGGETIGKCIECQVDSECHEDYFCTKPPTVILDPRMAREPWQCLPKRPSGIDGACERHSMCKSSICSYETTGDRVCLAQCKTSDDCILGHTCQDFALDQTQTVLACQGGTTISLFR